MSLWASSNLEDWQLEDRANKADEEASQLGNPLHILMNLERRAIRRIHPEVMNEDLEDFELPANEAQYVRNFISRRIK